MKEPDGYCKNWKLLSVQFFTSESKNRQNWTYYLSSDRVGKNQVKWFRYSLCYQSHNWIIGVISST